MSSKVINASKGFHVESWLEEMIRLGFIREVEDGIIKCYTKHYAVPKKDGRTRIVGDYKLLNEISVPMNGLKQDPLAIARKVAEKKYKVKLDLNSAFYLIPVEWETQPLLGLSIRGKSYCYTRMPMGTASSPAFFSFFLPSLLQPVLLEHGDSVRIYQNDVFIYNDCKQQTQKILKKIMTLLEAAKARVNKDKSVLFPVEELTVLGYRVGINSVSTEAARIDNVVSLIKSVIAKGTLSKRQRARIFGKISFLSIRSKDVQNALRPTYKVMTDMGAWTDTKALSSTEVNCWREAILMLRNSPKNTPKDSLFSEVTGEHGELTIMGRNISLKEYAYQPDPVLLPS